MFLTLSAKRQQKFAQNFKAGEQYPLHNPCVAVVFFFAISFTAKGLNKHNRYVELQ